jgi:hypothetical protein
MTSLEKITSLTLCVLLNTGCATMVRGPSQKLPVTTEPPGAVVDLRCMGAESLAAVTPATLRLPRKAEECTATISAAGHHTMEVPLQRERGGWFFGNIAPGAMTASIAFLYITLGTVVEGRTTGLELLLVPVALTGGGMLIDRGTGAMYNQMPQRIDVVLEPLVAEEPEAGATLFREGPR